MTVLSFPVIQHSQDLEAHCRPPPKPSNLSSKSDFQAHSPLRIPKRPQHTHTIARRTTHNQYMHELMTAPQQIKPPRKPPLRELDRVHHRPTELTTPKRNVPPQTHRPIKLFQALNQYTMHNRRKACGSQQAIDSCAHAMSRGTGEEWMQRSDCAKQGRKNCQGAVESLQLRFALESEMRARKRSAKKGRDNREVIELARHAANRLAVVEGNMVASIVSLENEMVWLPHLLWKREEMHTHTLLTAKHTTHPPK